MRSLRTAELAALFLIVGIPLAWQLAGLLTALVFFGLAYAFGFAPSVLLTFIVTQGAALVATVVTIIVQLR